METAMRNVSITDRTTPTLSPIIKSEPCSQHLSHQSSPQPNLSHHSSPQPNLPHLSSPLQDQPLDFSTKVRNAPPDDSSIRKVSNDSAIDVSEDSNRKSSNPTLSSQDSSLPSQDTISSRCLLSQPRSSLPMPNIHSLLPQASIPPIGMFYPGAPVFPNFLPPGFPPPPMWPNPMAAMVHQHEAARKLLSQATSTKNGGNGSRPSFNAKHLLGNKAEVMTASSPISRPMHPSLPPVFPGQPLPPSNMPDPSILAEALKSHEEMFTAYKQQVLNQKASDEAKRAPRRQVAATTTNGNHLSVSQNGSNSISVVESASLTQIDEDQAMTSPKEVHTNTVLSNQEVDMMDNGLKNSQTASIFPDVCKASESKGEVMEEDSASLVNRSNGHAAAGSSTTSSATASTGVSLHSSDESLQTNDGARSLTPAHSINGELSDIANMRPRSMTLPTQTTENLRLSSYSPSPSVLSTGNNSGPGTPNSKSDRGFRKRARTLPDDQKVKKRDEAYWERRRKNNEAAKRSRDSRRAKEDEIAIRAAFLEQENIRLRLELASLKTQTAKLRNELIVFQGPDDHAGTSTDNP